MSKPLTASSYLIIDGETKPFDLATDEEKKRTYRNMKKRVEISMTDYFTQHKEEFIQL